eukprot:Nitzschia sp. Nitz4//scaffold4_size323378//233615//235062//NITZ4_000692-RA/size323378-snap-gene-0.467-mRNA-1//-1//CDS//3329553495//1859//frame0
MPLRRLKGTKRKKASRCRGKTVRILFVIGWMLMLAFAGGAAWYLNQYEASRTTHRDPIQVGNLVGGGSKRIIPPQAPETAKAGLHEVHNLLPLSDDAEAYRSPLLIFTCQRANYLSQTLEDIVNNIPQYCGFGCPVIISEDGAHDEIAQVVQEYAQKLGLLHIPLFHLQHHQFEPEQPGGGGRQHLRGRLSPTDAYTALAQHYGWALTQVFDGLDDSIPTPDRVIILEEDIHTSPDFFSYFQATAPLLDSDPNLLAVSAFNDNGHMAQDPTRLLRSDFFPGLGWMMNRDLWKSELEAKWPQAYWDDWLREPDQRQGRHIIRPEFSRTFHFGAKGGASNNQFGSVLGQIKLSQEVVDWQSQDLSYLEETQYDKMYSELIRESTKVMSVTEALEQVTKSNTWLEYSDFHEFRMLANRLQIMDDEKAMVPRTAYKGVVEIKPSGSHILFLTPQLQELRKNFPGI